MLPKTVAAAVTLCLAFLSTSTVRAQDDPWADFRFLLGEWVNEGKPGEPAGAFTLEPELGGKVLVRRNRADVPAAKGRPAGKHEDLMVIYRAGKDTKASYYDNEGHVIQYTVAPAPDKKAVVFLSDPEPKSPRFRLTYTASKDARVSVKFEIAPPGTEQFKVYVEGVVRRKTAK